MSDLYKPLRPIAEDVYKEDRARHKEWGVYMNTLGWEELKVVALAVDDLTRAENFCRAKLGRESISADDGEVGVSLGGLAILVKSVFDQSTGAGKPPYPCLTFAVADAPRIERELAERGVRISDRVQRYEEGKFWVGALLDSEGNKLWFCSPVRNG